MTDPASPAASDAPLQFERAEFTEPRAAPQCKACERSITDTYFEVNGHLLCPSCRDTVAASLTGGSKSGRFFRALAFGTGAAAAGALVYFGVSAATGYNLGLIAVAVGWLVGTAVNKGSEGRGGTFYQLLAVGLTYLSICASLAPDVYEGMSAPDTEVAATPTTAAQAPGATPEGAAAAPVPEAATGEAAAPAPEAAAAGDTDGPAVEETSVAVRVIVSAIVSLAAPFIVGFNSPLSLLIYGFALWEAWRRNTRAVLNIAGPFQLAPAAAQESSEEGAAREQSVG
ncbi:hypothetical protein [Pyxidicoccus sp. MSG2]|uniref:hypothetical protein n=1 Tax=Pyxidicoccus sp. MSG2 TaxID=2996790 RepID=UPI002270008E|nr:hypothetical protein [Pyxidicoccus sp. MSG2]MCY1018046.1 hypothetical protein [Pyxidicoccus sp. MSG2]